LRCPYRSFGSVILNFPQACETTPTEASFKIMTTMDSISIRLEIMHPLILIVSCRGVFRLVSSTISWMILFIMAYWKHYGGFLKTSCWPWLIVVV